MLNGKQIHESLRIHSLIHIHDNGSRKRFRISAGLAVSKLDYFYLPLVLWPCPPLGASSVAVLFKEPFAVPSYPRIADLRKCFFTLGKLLFLISFQRKSFGSYISNNIVNIPRTLLFHFLTKINLQNLNILKILIYFILNI